MLSKKDYRAEAVLDYFNKRLRIDDYRGKTDSLLKDASKLASDNRFTKVIVKGKACDITNLLKEQFQLEAIIKNYFHGEDAYFFTKYLSEERRKTDSWTKQDSIITSINEKKKTVHLQSGEFGFRAADEHDAEKLAELYKAVFDVYPTPLHSSDYIQKTMRDGTIYFLAEKENTIVSAASAEINAAYNNAEITDCATLPEVRKHKLMRSLILLLEQKLCDQGVFCVYSIARAESFGMNAVLHQLDYEYTGRLTNNCVISTDLENMNVWCKDLSAGN
ncbi:putative beta-lysine N-acetyltransferase [Bacillus idriensis]|uniref:Putative beta-lysine N-acetyltransferase n=2 Tax=Metabacillus idriensis TaxID=324768 RepID=A0A6I2MLF2_9BACI|nr:putative beta-lysine N-acetyltransferase [Metabacillus idriensis]MRX56693.1 putative beta-lysine N-acetyltransferase [Metabacillus idriensis]